MCDNNKKKQNLSKAQKDSGLGSYLKIKRSISKIQLGGKFLFWNMKTYYITFTINNMVLN